MVLDPEKREIRLKVVYYGPVVSGKTTNVVFISQHYPGPKGILARSEGLRGMTVVVDLLPIEVTLIKGYRARVFLYTVPGQYFFKPIRRIVLRGTDGVVFVADSQAGRMEDNKRYLLELFEGLKSFGRIRTPIVMQYNKQDLPEALPPKEIDQILNPYRFPTVPAVAIRGRGVFRTLELVLKAIVRVQIIPAVRKAGQARSSS
ncbi:MAG: ADP-ribosylation factor-like protein [Candidatus Hydrothermae bacterium]|nr:ADP-ribosylation factor-like protein [Candidatus Hydrothermae bacterium]